jgi:hypothetical protein
MGHVTEAKVGVSYVEGCWVLEGQGKPVPSAEGVI